MATDELSATCCSEERMISIYEGTESLKDSYKLVIEAINNKDTVNVNAITIKKLWEDSLRANRMNILSTTPTTRQ